MVDAEHPDTEPLLSLAPGAVVPTASVGKVLLLVAAARRIADGTLDPRLPLTRTADDAVADSGLWQHLAVDTLPVADVCALVGAVSDNVATNLLVRHLGLASVARTADALGLTRTKLLDRVRDQRRADDPPTLSVGCAGELADLVARLDRGEVVSRAVSTRVTDWLATNTDLSMVASAFDLDPLAHAITDRGVRLWNKTGTDTTLRADVGLVAGPTRTLAYAVLVAWDDDAPSETRGEALKAMGEIGAWVRGHVDPPPTATSRTGPQ